MREFRFFGSWFARKKTIKDTRVGMSSKFWKLVLAPSPQPSPPMGAREKTMLPGGAELEKRTAYR
jgi:hypothetical protein